MTASGCMTIPLDNDGYLLQPEHWNQSVAEALAAKAGITLTAAHWEIIDALRDFYHRYGHVPSQRPFVQHIANSLGTHKGNSLYLMTLFPESPAKIAACIAGLPRPAHCF